jgi:uncharacterized phiE125 gp8 family phage protein
LLASLITTARLQIEAALSLALITQSWSWTFDRWPRATTVELPMAPVQTITAIRVSQAGGTAISVDPSAYILDSGTGFARLIGTSCWPQPTVRARGIEIQLIAGFGPAAADVPAPIRQAVLLLAAYWHGRREAGSACRRTPPSKATTGPLPSEVNALLQPYRSPRL